MNTYTTYTEIQMMVTEKLEGGKRQRERITLDPHRSFRVGKMVTALLSLIF